MSMLVTRPESGMQPSEKAAAAFVVLKRVYTWRCRSMRWAPASFMSRTSTSGLPLPEGRVNEMVYLNAI